MWSVGIIALGLTVQLRAESDAALDRQITIEDLLAELDQYQICQEFKQMAKMCLITD